MYISWKDKEMYLDSDEYRNMMLSEYVRKSLNPRVPRDCEETTRLSEKFSDKTKFVIHNGVGLWCISDGKETELRPVPMTVAYYARFLGYGIVINRHRKTLDDYHAQEIERYRRYKESHPISDEERFEIAAAFGEDATVVDVITGEVVQHGRH